MNIDEKSQLLKKYYEDIMIKNNGVIFELDNIQKQSNTIQELTKINNNNFINFNYIDFKDINKSITSSALFFPDHNVKIVENKIIKIEQDYVNNNLNVKNYNRMLEINNNYYYSENKQAHKQQQKQHCAKQLPEQKLSQNPKKKRRYLRSTNNSHKKFTFCLRRIFFSFLSYEQKFLFQQSFKKHQNSRVYFFVILAYIKYFSAQNVHNMIANRFIEEMKKKVKEYEEEIQKTSLNNLKVFRKEEIDDIQCAVRVMGIYFGAGRYQEILQCTCKHKNNKIGLQLLHTYPSSSHSPHKFSFSQKAIQCMYKKNKTTIIKRQHYEYAVKQIYKIEKKFVSKRYQRRGEGKDGNNNEYNMSSKCCRCVVENDNEDNKDDKDDNDNDRYLHLLSGNKQQHQCHQRQQKQQQRYQPRYQAKPHLPQHQKQICPLKFPKAHHSYSYDNKKFINHHYSNNNHNNHNHHKHKTQQIIRHLFPPLLQYIPYVKYDPYCPPYWVMRL